MIASLAQKVIKGKVSSQLDNNGIEFANIGIPNTNIGTISNNDGTFSLSVPLELQNDTILFSALGYHTRAVPLSLIDAEQPMLITLFDKVTELETVTVYARKEKKKTFWLGNKYHQGGHFYSDSIAGGAAMALLIENKYPAYHKDLEFPVFVEKALLNISANTLNEFKVRIRFLEVDSVTKLPGNDLLNENVIVTSRMKNGWLTFDLSQYKFRIDQPVLFMVFEWILDDEDRINLLNQYKQYKTANPENVTLDTMVVRGEKVPYYNWRNFKAGTSFGVSPIPFSLNNYQCFYRRNSFGNWRRASAILTARLLVSDQPPKEIVRR